jgi:hypothetical protein
VQAEKGTKEFVNLIAIVREANNGKRSEGMTRDITSKKLSLSKCNGVCLHPSSNSVIVWRPPRCSFTYHTKESPDFKS